MTSKRAYRSTFEETVGAILVPAGALYEPYKVPYFIAANYTPDFVVQAVDRTLNVECKGYFRPGDTKKYVAINEAIVDEGDELVFLLQYPDKKVRKGAKLTMSGWCEKNDIPWFASAEEVLTYANAQ